jgi:hypothetical protein
MAVTRDAYSRQCATVLPTGTLQAVVRALSTRPAVWVGSDSPFDNNNRLLAYVAPNYSAAERRAMPRKDRSTFNLDLVEHGWAVPFVIYPSVPGELDLPLLVDAAATARTASRGIWAQDATLLAYEYRAMEKLFRITKKIVAGDDMPAGEAHSWRERYCVDMRTRTLHGPEDYFDTPPEYRLLAARHQQGGQEAQPRPRPPGWSPRPFPNAPRPVGLRAPGRACPASPPSTTWIARRETVKATLRANTLICR